MRVLVRRVSDAAVRVDAQITGRINKGLLVLTAFEDAEDANDLVWMAQTLVPLHISPDQAGVMNCSVIEAGDDILAMSQSIFKKRIVEL